MFVANPVPGLPQKPQLPPKPAKPTVKTLKGEVELPNAGTKTINPWRTKMGQANLRICDAKGFANDLYVIVDHLHKTAGTSINDLYKHLKDFQSRLAKAEKDRAEMQVKLQKSQSEKFACSRNLTTVKDNFKAVTRKYSTSKVRLEKLMKEKAALEEEVKSLKRESRASSDGRTCRGASEERTLRASQLRVDEHHLKLQDKLDMERQKRDEAAQVKNKRLESFSRTNGMLSLGSTGMFT
jgi:chromosome segregation ATPase